VEELEDALAIAAEMASESAIPDPVR